MNPAFGGPCQGIRNSIPALKSLGVENEVVCMDDPNEEFIQKDDFVIHAVGKSNGPWAKNANLYDWLLAHLATYDVVIVHGLWQYHVYAVRNAYNKLKQTHGTSLPKVYVMPHGMLDPYFQKAEGRKLKALRNYIYWHLLESKNIESLDGLLFTCEEEMRLAATSFKPYRPKKTFNVSYGVQAPPAQNDQQDLQFLKEFPTLQQGKYLLFLSRIHPKKGVDILLKSYEHVYAGNEMAPQLAIAGPGIDTAFGQSLTQMVNASEFLKRKVIFTGMLQGQKKWSAFYNCEAFVLPSHQENFGIAVAEALACKCPVIISNKVNIFAEIEHSNAGIICSDTHEGISEALNSWKKLSDEDKHTMKNKAYSLYQSAFTNEAAAARLLEVLNNELHTQTC